MPAGRPPKGPRLVEGLDASEEAKSKLKVILETIAGDLSVSEACERLVVSESRFHQLREETLAIAAAGLEAKPRGRPRKEPPELALELARLRDENEALKQELEKERVRTVLAEGLPHVGKDREEKKTAAPVSRKDRRKKRKQERQRRKGGE